MRRAHRTSGFTLIELSIVLVIIGLLVGGILVGRDLILAANIRATVNQIALFDQAVATFRLKYNCLPGDCPNAESLGLEIAGISIPNGDGYVYCGGGMHEPIAFWRELSNAKLIKETFPQYNPSFNGYGGCDGTHTRCVPAAKLPIQPNSPAEYAASSAGWAAITPKYQTGYDGSHFTGITGRLYYWLSNNTIEVGVTNGVSIVIPLHAYMLDTKLDDGLPMTGRVMARGNASFIDPYDHAEGCGPVDAHPDRAQYDADTLDEDDNVIGTSTIYQDVCVDNSTGTDLYSVGNESGAVDSLCSLTVMSSAY